jgi:multidrug efflux pump
MHFTDLFIRRPVLALVISLVIIIAGLQAIRSLNVRQFPISENSAVTVTTVYVGASAELVRGFITTPLERAIAAADGIDYIESQSAQGVSTINVRLKLNYDATKALAEVSSKVDQVRRDLPPEAEVPVINIESADSRFAAAYLSFTSTALKQNEITDYLVRIVQPRLSAVEGVQRADILGARTFAPLPCASGSNPTAWPPTISARPRFAGPWPPTTILKTGINCVFLIYYSKG